MTTDRHHFTAALVQAARGYRELRVHVYRTGTADPVALIALPGSTADTPDVLAAFGWRIVGEPEYVAGPNEERGQVEPCTPTEGNAAEGFRSTVRREIRARALARLAHPTARQFHPVPLNGNGALDPVGWSYIAGTGADVAGYWVTAQGTVAQRPEGSRADAARTARHTYQIEQANPPADQPPYGQLTGCPGEELARLLLTARNGGDVLPAVFAHDLAEAGAEEPPFRRGDRIVCADGVTRTAEGMAVPAPGESQPVVIADGAVWFAGDCVRANAGDVLDAHRRAQSLAMSLRIGLHGQGEGREPALAELLDVLSVLGRIDPTARVALAEDRARAGARRVHADACGFQPLHHPGEEEPHAWTFRTRGEGGTSRYGVVTRAGEVAPVGLYEYPTTAERAYLQHLTAPVG